MQSTDQYSRLFYLVPQKKNCFPLAPCNAKDDPVLRHRTKGISAVIAAPRDISIKHAAVNIIPEDEAQVWMTVKDKDEQRWPALKMPVFSKRELQEEDSLLP
ncbi:hypothetical protein Y1Q_0005327 [Alligator mississippiensis]|uniref:Uncharacterized protein n=1 Tax=Alligator mississippiensis TaxID=8496 RepID=A0A151MVK6_ALLMI|nr:hypothetical protein Y1Q_0005327 [Alligator mississippiensis]